MAANTQPIFPITPNFWSVSIAPADTTATKTVGTSGANGGRVMRLLFLSTDTVARDVNILIGGVIVGCVSVPALCGQPAAPATVGPLDAFASTTLFKLCYFDQAGNLCLDLPASTVLGVAAAVTITAAKTITAVAVEGDF